MELKSEPKFDSIQVIDLDIAFPGDLQTYMVRPEDTLTHAGDVITLTFANGGSLLFNMQHAHWIARRHRTLRVVVPDAPKE